ncbi:MAG: hypothetical protein A2041_02230 [Bacteroidetes bacterium GWA2_31_9b]|nr:MAG: hypothetical protein A2041_02230 [Bacteroidetes bacterium GWA2_31_9b]
MKKQILNLTVMLIISISCNLEKSKLTDIDGNEYKTKVFGKNTWMLENLRVIRDSNGNDITFYYPNQDTSLAKTYGLLYDYENACKVCPKGWHLPSNEEWTELIKLYESEPVEIFKNNKFWNNTMSSNENGFLIIPSGYGNNGEFDNAFKQRAIIWSKTKQDTHFVWTYGLQKGVDTFRIVLQHPTYAFSVRCVKDK